MSEPERDGPEAPLRKRTFVARLVGLLALLVLLAAPVGPALLRALRPQLVVDACFDRDFNEIVPLAGKGLRLDDAPKDPWGNPWHLRMLKVGTDEFLQHAGRKHMVFGQDADPTLAFAIYSGGPDGHDDGGYGDDIFPVAFRSKFLALIGVSHVSHLLGALALVLAWWWLWLLPQRRGTLAEAVYAIVLASLPTALAVGGVLWTRDVRSRQEALPATPFVLVPREVAAVGSAALFALLLGAGLRLLGATRLVSSERDEDGGPEPRDS